MSRQPFQHHQPSLMPWQVYDLSGLATRPLYFYVGAGLSSYAGLVGWSELACLIWWYVMHYEQDPKAAGRCPSDVGPENARFLQSFVRKTDRVGFPILSRMSKDPRGLGRTALLNMMLRYRAPWFKFQPDRRGGVQPTAPEEPRKRPGKPPDPNDLALHGLIWRSRCSGVLTSNYDMLLEHAYTNVKNDTRLRSYRYNAAFLRYLLSNPKFVLKLHGDINDIATMQFDPVQAWTNVGAFQRRDQQGGDLMQVYKSCLNLGHMVYVGCGFRDETIKRLHDSWVQSASAPSSHCRIALIPNDVEREDLSSFSGIQFLTFEPGQFQEAKKFLERVVDARSRAREPVLKRQGWTCPEAWDIYEQIFLSESVAPPARQRQTEPWTCQGVPRGERSARGRV